MTLLSKPSDQVVNGTVAGSIVAVADEYTVRETKYRKVSKNKM